MRPGGRSVASGICEKAVNVCCKKLCRCSVRPSSVSSDRTTDMAESAIAATIRVESKQTKYRYRSTSISRARGDAASAGLLARICRR